MRLGALLLLLLSSCYVSHEPRFAPQQAGSQAPYRIAPGSPAYWDSGYPIEPDAGPRD